MRELKMLVQKISRAPLAVIALAVVAVALTVAAAFPWLATQAQRASKEPTVNVTNVTTRPSGGGEVVSITADAPLSHAQTWTDDEGFHVVGYKWNGAFAGVPRGVKVRRVGNSLELVVATRAGASVTVAPRANSLDVIVSGGIQRANAEDETKVAAQRETQTRAQQSKSVARKTTSEPESQPASKPESTRASRNERQLAIAAVKVGSFERASASEKKNAVAAALTQEARQVKSAQSNAQHALDAQVKNDQTRSQQNAARQAQATQSTPAQSSASQKGNAKDSPAQTSTPQNAVAQNATAQSSTVQSSTVQSSTTQSSSVQGAQPASDQSSADHQAQQAASQGAQVAATPLLVAAVTPAAGGSFKFALMVVGGFLCVGLVVFLFIFRKQQRAARAGSGDEAAAEKMEVAARETVVAKSERSVVAKSQPGDADAKDGKIAKPAVKTEADGALVKRESRTVVTATSAPPMLFGAFRIEQEVDKLVRGSAHAVEVLASRAADDRRAVEASLLKALTSPELSEGERGRARAALEEYGFVARQSASVLLAPDAYERSAAARTLGRVKSPASLPFLLEALYDSDTVVRAEAVASLGTLGLPRAIGALLDAARRHPEIPVSLVARALDACSVDAVEFDSLIEDEFTRDGFTGDITQLQPVAAVDQLPEWLDDETLADALERLAADDVEARVAAAQQLSQFQVKRAVDALTAMAMNDKDSPVRAAAITSLGLINHESVFASVLIAMADESREVRAAAARTLSRLSFDRADAYVRVLETADAETLKRTAEACVTAGLARQAMDRLASDDRRQAYEAFSLLSLVARGGQSDVLLHVVKGHPDLNVRLASARLLALQGDEAVSNRLRQIAMEGTTPEQLREAILEVCERRGQARTGDSSLRIEGDKSAQPIA
jgi:HEAT repeat protein